MSRAGESRNRLGARRGNSPERLGHQGGVSRRGGRRLAAASRPGRGRLAAARCAAPLTRAPPLPPRSSYSFYFRLERRSGLVKLAAPICAPSHCTELTSFALDACCLCATCLCKACNTERYQGVSTSTDNYGAYQADRTQVHRGGMAPRPTAGWPRKQLGARGGGGGGDDGAPDSKGKGACMQQRRTPA